MLNKARWILSILSFFRLTLTQPDLQNIIFYFLFVVKHDSHMFQIQFTWLALHFIETHT